MELPRTKAAIRKARYRARIESERIHRERVQAANQAKLDALCGRPWLNAWPPGVRKCL